MSIGQQMPMYQCHKKVRALKIAEVAYNGKGQYILVFENEFFEPVNPGWKWFQKHRPQPGGYYVVYDDGYRSYSPGETFEAGYTKL